MIDAERAGVAHVDGEEMRERLRGRGDGVRGRQAPHLSVGRERVGRCADGNAAREIARAGPGLGAVRRSADRDVAIEAEGEARRLPTSGRLRQLGGGQPLQIQVEADPRFVLSREGLDARGDGTAQRFVPGPPGLPRQGLADRFEDGEAAKRRAAGEDEAIHRQDVDILGAGASGARRKPRKRPRAPAP